MPWTFTSSRRVNLEAGELNSTSPQVGVGVRQNVTEPFEPAARRAGQGTLRGDVNPKAARMPDSSNRKESESFADE